MGSAVSFPAVHWIWFITWSKSMLLQW